MSEQGEQAAQSVAEYITQRQQWLADGVEILTGSREADPQQVFPAPTEVRDDSAPLTLDEHQEAALREVAGRFGVGGEVNIPASCDYEIVEGGKPWKVDAEASISTGIQIFAGTNHRTIGNDESTYLRTKGCMATTEPMSEYDMIDTIARKQPGFRELTIPVVLSYGYDINNKFALVTEPTGQLVQIGTKDGEPVMLLRVDREVFVNDEGQSKYRNQPDSAALMGFVSDALSANGNTTASVGLLTSSTYASRSIDAVRAGLSHGRPFAVGMYGRQTLADTKGESVASPSGINQIPGELHTIAKKLDQLQQAVTKQ
jgi:hypothetical protein